jgi:hypothetical protein
MPVAACQPLTLTGGDSAIDNVSKKQISNVHLPMRASDRQGNEAG